MIGKYDITLYNNKVHYHLTIKRNITILRGDSASGKSEFIRLLSAYNSNPASSGITLISDNLFLVSPMKLGIMQTASDISAGKSSIQRIFLMRPEIE